MTRNNTPAWDMTVLLAEDDHEMRTMLKDILNARGAFVVEVLDGFMLIEQVENYIRAPKDARPFDFIITDHRMPGAMGAAVVEVLRRYEQTIPVLMISAFADDQLIKKVRAQGAAEILKKPFEIADLESQISTLWSRAQTAQLHADVR